MRDVSREICESATTSSLDSISGGGYGSQRVTPEEKATWLKKELASSMSLKEMPSEICVGQLVASLTEYYKDSEQFLVIYTDLLKAILSS